VFVKRALRRIFGPKSDDVIGGWKKLQKEELHNMYSSTSIIRIIKARRIRCAGHIARMYEKMNKCRISVEREKGKRSLKRPRHRWVLREIGWGGMQWIVLAQVEGYCEHGNGTLNSIKCWKILQ
jgi:hypothetical protein